MTAKKVDWYYHRNGCTTCKKSQEFLTNHSVNIKEQLSASKEKFGEEKALELAHQANQIFVAKGKKLVSFDMKKSPPTNEELAKHMLGPTGNLRAPTIVSGKKLFVGFSQETFDEYFGTAK